MPLKPPYRSFPLQFGFESVLCTIAYTTLLTENRLNEHLHRIDEQAHEQIDLHIAQMAKQMGVTEELKASDPMRWVQMMNNIKASAEEIVLKEVVYK